VVPGRGTVGWGMDGRPRHRVRLTVAHRAIVAHDTVELVLVRPDGADLPRWEPGAHVDLHLPDGLTRQYSLCGEPDDGRSWTVCVHRAPNSRGGSSTVHAELQVGRTVDVGTPRNHFPLEDSDHYVFIAGGIGVTPLVPMATEAARRGATVEFHLGGRTTAHLAYLDRLARLGLARFVTYAERDEGRLPVGPIMSGARGLVYCCGPAGLIEAVRHAALDRPGVGVRWEAFTPPESSTEPTAFDVELRQSGLTVRVATDQSILDVVTAAGVFVPTSCEEGTCGSCETRVIAGRPDHRDAITQHDDPAADEYMMVCVSRSRDPLLVLDL